jgi:UDP-2,3-diacylglucosamine pyrophosphatase LpxH
MPLNLREYDLMVVSDLHLSEGRDAGTKKFSLNEDFFFDEEFARLLDYQMHRIVGRPRERKWHLIINGDFLDFLQVVSTGVEREVLEYLHVNTQKEALQMLSFDQEHPEYGFGCGPHETVYKLWKIMDGHWIFFEALADFVADGNVVTIGRGNHDVEFIYPEVQQALAPKLRRMYDDKLRRENDLERSHKLDLFDQAVEGNRIRFMDWFYYEEGLIWVEHGNQYEEANAFRYWLCPLLPASASVDPKRKDEIDLPWGSFFVRYLFNKVEQKEPFADNIKPQTKFISWFLTHHPLMALGFLFGGNGRYMLKKMARAFKFVPEDAYAARREEHLKRLRQLAVDSGIPEDRVLFLDSQRSASVLREPHGVWKLIGILTRHWRISLTLLFVVLVLAVIGAVLFFSHLVSPLIPHQAQNLLRILLSHWPWILSVLSVLRWPLAALVALAVCWFVWWLLASDKSSELCYLVERARRVREMFGVQYVTMGHTHDADLQSIGSQGQEYFNTGTWTKVFSQEEQLIRDPSELLVLQGVRRPGGMTVKLLQWEDGAREPRLVKLFGANPD